MSIRQDIQKLAPGVRIELLEVDASALGGGHLYFHAGTTAGRAPVVWQTITYTPWPYMAEGFEYNGRGQLPTPRLRLANIGGTVTAFNLAYDDMVGARVIRRRTMFKYLDGQPGADPTAGFPDDIFYIERKVSQNKLVVEYELASALDLQGVMLPKRQVIANLCSWGYRSAECSYAGPAVATALDIPTSDLALDACSKRLTGCRKRFGKNGPLPYGGFVSASALSA